MEKPYSFARYCTHPTGCAARVRAAIINRAVTRIRDANFMNISLQPDWPRFSNPARAGFVFGWKSAMYHEAASSIRLRQTRQPLIQFDRK